MKIYFSAAIAQKDDYGGYYQRIVKTLESLGHQVMQDTTEVDFNEAYFKTTKQRVAYYQHVMDWISQADLLVVEVSFPSTLHIGHEISLALEKGRPVVGLYKLGSEPCFFLGNQDERLIFVPYTHKDLEEVVRKTLKEAKYQLKVRFSMYLTVKVLKFLEHIRETRGIAKSVYIRKLIEKEMRRAKFQP